MIVQNAKYPPQVFYALHMEAGVAEYREPGKEPVRYLIEEQCAKIMDPTFQGRPIYVLHVDEENLETIQADSAGYVVESFFNPMDGKHWSKIIIISDLAHESLKKGWKVSNSYLVKRTKGGGQWHGIDYDSEIIDGEYKHMAIVPNPRYENSIVLTPEDFKLYNQEKELELKRLANSKDKEEGSMKFNLFKRTKVENSKESGIDLESMSVELPKSKREVTLTKLVNDADEKAMNEGNPAYADLKSMVKVGENEMTVDELMNAYCGLMKENESDVTEDGEGGEMDNEKDPVESDDKKKQNEEDEKAKKDADEKEKALKNANFNKLKNAANNKTMTNPRDEMVADTSKDQVARGKTRYGS